MQYLKEYQGFGVNLYDISRLFLMIGKGETGKAQQLAETGYGTNKIRAIKEYLVDFDLLSTDKTKLTGLGQSIFNNDPRFRESFTRWLLLYHWSLKENNPYLNFLVNNAAGLSSEEKILYKFKSWAAKNDVKTDYEGDMLQGMIRNTENALNDVNAFSILNFFQPNDGVMERAEPFQVTPLLISYILYLNRRKRTSIGFSEVLREENNLGRFFNLDPKSLDKHIVDLNNIGLTRLIQYADLHFIEYTYDNDPISLVERYYNEN